MANDKELRDETVSGTDATEMNTVPIKVLRPGEARGARDLEKWSSRRLVTINPDQLVEWMASL